MPRLLGCSGEATDAGAAMRHKLALFSDNYTVCIPCNYNLWLCWRPDLSLLNIPTLHIHVPAEVFAPCRRTWP